jgi:hypothetical protein
MTNKELQALLSGQFDRLQQLSSTKGKEYARDDSDTLANFKRLGVSLDMSPEAILFVYLAKHMDAITHYIAKRGWDRPQGESEPITGRIDDAVLYLILLKGLLRDRALSAPGGGPGVHPSVSQVI